MVDATDKTALPKSSTDSPPAGANADKGSTSQARSASKAGGGARLAAAAIDEILANEALANLKRTRVTTRAEPLKLRPRISVPPATLVVKPPPSQPWLTPFITLAALVGICTLLCSGGIAYLILRPAAVGSASTAELRNMREQVARLQRTVTALSNEVSTNRAALDAANKAASDRFGRFVHELERVEADQTASATKIERIAEEKAQVARAVPAVSPTEITTGTIERQQRPTNARREVIPGWRVRRAFEGVAVLEGQPGVIEVALGQDVANIGRIEDIKYENNRWRVVTSKGVILSGR